jgi:hypothetical protein
MQSLLEILWAIFSLNHWYSLMAAGSLLIKLVTLITVKNVGMKFSIIHLLDCTCNIPVGKFRVSVIFPFCFIFSLLSFLRSKKSKLVRSPCSLSECLCAYAPFQVLNHWTNFYEIRYTCYAIGVHTNCVIFNFPTIVDNVMDPQTWWK